MTNGTTRPIEQIKAGDLSVGTSIVTRAGPSLALHEATTKHTARVYNFEVADFHTYFVGKSAIWVHNQLCTFFDAQILAQMPGRGWTRQDVLNAIANPIRRARTYDRHGGWNDPATAYFVSNNHYVVRNDITGEVIQVANKNAPGWIIPNQFVFLD